MDEEETQAPTAEKPDPTVPTDGNGQDVECLFMVVVGRQGGSTVVTDPNMRFNVARMATAQDVYGALANCLADFAAMKTGEAVIALQQQYAQQMAQQAQMQAMQQRLQQPGGFGGLSFPPR